MWRQTVLVCTLLLGACQSTQSAKLGPQSSVPQPEFALTSKAVGDVVRWRADNGNTSVTYLGTEGAFGKIRFERDNSKGQPLSGTILTTPRGEAVQADFGTVRITFRPSDCQLTVGRCGYREENSAQGTRTVISNISVEGDLWTYTLHHTRETPENLIEEGTFTVDEFGYTIDRDYTQFSNGTATKRWSKRIN